MFPEKKLLFATQNKGKAGEVSQLFSSMNLNFATLLDLGIDSDTNETGATFEENAILKVSEALRKINTDAIIMADDSGIEIDALGGEPGVHTRRWSGKTMTDDEILAYCLARLNGVPSDKRTARFRSVVAVGSKSHDIKTFEGQLEGVILNNPVGSVRKGLPFCPVFYVPNWKMLLSDTYDLPPHKKSEYITHRVQAFQKAIPYILAISE